ncbi:hypothetical protein CK203_000424 [Vitis vinifera]|uniref:AB hydrolase-1 domain-containing protein n=2 Tax=Vitis vinifera TaxID=29760 RepID=A0A438KQ59_VITVI|nr:hypothetical protein CK203_000424 [Vitis vinifera]
MAKCFSFTATRDWCFRLSFSNAGLRSTTSDLGDGTVMHCWIPKARKENKPNLVLIHGMGANAMWQWADFIRPLIARFNVYVPDLVFFGDSYTTRPERSESFQAQCVMRMIEGHGVSRMNVVGISYGGFVAYRIAEQFPAAVERSVLCCAGVCLEEKDMEAGMFQVSSVEDAASILLPQTPEKVRELMRISFAKPINTMPSCFLNDFIDVKLLLLVDKVVSVVKFIAWKNVSVPKSLLRCNKFDSAIADFENNNYEKSGTPTEMVHIHMRNGKHQLNGFVNVKCRSISRKVLQTHKPDPFDILYWIEESEKGIPCLMKKKRRMLFEEVECRFLKGTEKTSEHDLAAGQNSQVMCTEHLQERRELIRALHKDRKLSNLPKITQPTLIIWGELDRVFPLELAHRLKRHIGENAELVIIKNAGHAINAEKPKELCKYLKSFLIDPLPPQNGKSSNGNKTD